MYAVIVSGGKQYRVAPGQTLKLEKIAAEVGSTIHFEQVLMVANGAEVRVGAKNLAGAKVSAEVVSHGRHDKVKIIKFRRRKHHRKQMGHRQYFTQVKISDIAAQ